MTTTKRPPKVSSALVELRSVPKFRRLMTDRGMSVRALASAANVSSGFIAHLRSKDRQRRANITIALAIAEALEVEPTEIWKAPAELAKFIEEPRL